MRKKALVVLTVSLAAVAIVAAPASAQEQPVAIVASSAQAETVVLTTEQSEFEDLVPNQGFWSDSGPNQDRNPVYVVGVIDSGEFRNFFTFDVSTVSRPIVAATLEVQRAAGSGDPTETLGLFDVLTDAATLNQNDGINASVFADLGEGDAYGTFEVSTTGDAFEFLQFPLTEAGVSDANAARGGFFSIGGRLLSVSPDPGKDEFLFGASFRAAARLVLELADVPQSPSDCKNGGWRNLTDVAGQPFKNQGQCVSFIVRTSQAA